MNIPTIKATFATNEDTQHKITQHRKLKMTNTDPAKPVSVFQYIYKIGAVS